MRLLSITLRNYRTHKEITIPFDASRTLIGGPNESGKSTFAEAIHRALFLRSKTGGSLREEMRSTRHSGEPEIELVFDGCGSRWTVEKRFAGTKGHTRLSNSTGSVYKDDEAESKLAGILKCDTNGGRLSANQLGALWSHLWVWQGSSGTDPSGHTSDHKDTLVQRLQQEGLAAVVQSANDQRVREKIAAAYDELFTSRGPRTGSKPEVARAQLGEAEAAYEKARDTAARLEEASAGYDRAEQEIAAVEAVLPHLREQKALTESKLAEVETLRRDEDTKCQLWESAANHLQQLAEQDATIRKLQAQALTARDSLHPAEQHEATLRSEEERAAELCKSSETAHRDCAGTIRLLRLQYDVAAALILQFEREAQLQKTADRSGQASQIRIEIAVHQEALAKLPDLTPKDLESLRQLDRLASQASASLDAMATGVELVSANASVTLDGHLLTPGESRTVTEVGELCIGPDLRIRIRPGGGTSLAEARVLADNSRSNLTAALARLALRDPDHATAVLQHRQTLTQKIAQLETQWKTLGGTSLLTELAQATSAHEAAKAEVQRRVEATDAAPRLPFNPEDARQLHATLQQSLQDAGEAEAHARHQADLHRQRLETASADLRNHLGQSALARQSLRDLETRLQVLAENHGDTKAREGALVEATALETRTAAQLSAIRSQLHARFPDQLTADLERFTRAIGQQEVKRREAENHRLITRDRLTLDGSSDPQAELALAAARRKSALELHQNEQRRALAISRLHQLFSSSREAIDRSIIQPLADRITGYLQCLFGPGASIRVMLSEGGIEGFELLRPGTPAFAFGTLSGGAKEQVAAAVRLAMAEILASDHDGSLPILFDDAFAYTDPGRIHSLQRMLDLAASRGLQIIVLSCNPADYTAFGAGEICLARG